MSLPELCLGYRGSDSTSVASSLRPTYYMYLSPGVGAFKVYKAPGTAKALNTPSTGSTLAIQGRLTS